MIASVSSSSVLKTGVLMSPKNKHIQAIALAAWKPSLLLLVGEAAGEIVAEVGES